MRHERMETLVRQLLDLGYHSGQVKQIIDEAAKEAKESDNPETWIIDSLESYILFAAKCRKNGRLC